MDGTDTEVSLDGSAITLQNGAVATGNGAALTIGSAGVTKTLTGDLTATDKGVVTATLSGTYTGDAVASDAGTLSLRAVSYTHLDVYKRQDQAHTGKNGGPLRGNGSRCSLDDC